MVITYHGQGYFKLQLGATTVALGPVSKDSKHKNAQFGADIALVSVMHPDMNGIDSVTRGDKEPFAITGPGEYEMKDVFIRGFGTKTEYDGRSHNTVYLINMEDMNICYLGGLSSIDLPKKLEGSIDNLDILIVPIGGNGMLTPKDAHKLGVRLEPKAIIPMYHTDNDLKTFLKEEGETNGKPIDKLTIKPRDLAGKSGDIIVLKAQ